MTLQPSIPSIMDKAIGYQFFLPSQRAYDCDPSSPNRDDSMKLNHHGYMIQSIAPDCSFVIYKRLGVVYVVFKGTDSMRTAYQDLKMSSSSFWGWLSGGNRSATFIDEIIDSAHSAIGATNTWMPRRYTGHSLGGALAMAAYIRYGRPQDRCQVFSPYMYLLLAEDIRRWNKENKIIVWAHKDDRVWKMGWGNYELENPSDSENLIWYDTSDGVSVTTVTEQHYMANMIDYFLRDIQGVQPPAADPLDVREHAVIIDPNSTEITPNLRRSDSIGSDDSFVLVLEP